ncbi:MAG: S8 family serine peptidase [Candidatus Hermodarchaeota archaeon]
MFDQEWLKKRIESDRKLEEESERYIVTFREAVADTRSADISTLLKKHGGSYDVIHQFSKTNALAIKLKVEKRSLRSQQAFIKKLATDPRIESIEKDRRMRIMLDVSVPLIQAPKVWEDPEGNKGKGVVVSVVDTGVDEDHPDLKGRVTKVKDFTGEGHFDGIGHATHVAGIIGGTGEASGGKYTGIAPECTLISAKVLNSQGSGWMSDVIAGVEWSATNGAQIINMSLGSQGPCNGTDAISRTCQKLAEEGVIMVIAAGNSGPDPGTVGSPGCARKVITVGASNDQDTIAWFSSRGPTLDGRVKPDICFPGFEIIAARAKNTEMGTIIDDHYTQASGTSMATPHAAGVAALLVAKESTLKCEDIKSLLCRHAKNMGLSAHTQGWGRGQAYESFKSVGEPTIPVPETSNLWDKIKMFLRKLKPYITWGLLLTAMIFLSGTGGGNIQP